MRTLGLVSAAACVLVGCGGGDNPSAGAPTVTATVTETAPLEADTPTPEAEDPYAPNLGDRALRVGQTREGRLVKMTLEEIRYPYPAAEFREPGQGQVFFGLRLTQCLSDEYDGAEAILSSFNGEWTAVTPGGQEFGAGLTYDDWPAPKFPELVGMIPGRCLKGWVTLEVPQGTRAQTMLYRSEGTAVAEWLAKSG